MVTPYAVLVWLLAWQHAEAKQAVSRGSRQVLAFDGNALADIALVPGGRSTHGLKKASKSPSDLQAVNPAGGLAQKPSTLAAAGATTAQVEVQPQELPKPAVPQPPLTRAAARGAKFAGHLDSGKALVTDVELDKKAARTGGNSASRMCGQKPVAWTAAGEGPESSSCRANASRCEEETSNNEEPILCCQRQNLLSILEFVDRVLCGKVSYTLHGQTLLSSLRDKHLGDWDLTADVAVHAQDLQTASKLLQEAARTSGPIGPVFFVKRTGAAKAQAPLRITRGKQSVVHVSLLPLQVSGNCSRVKGEWYPRHLFKGGFAAQCELHGRSFPCPGEGAALLDLKYGNGRGGERHSWRNTTLGAACKDGEDCSVESHGFSCRAPIFSSEKVVASMPSFARVLRGFIVVYVLVMALMVFLGVRCLPLSSAMKTLHRDRLLMKRHVLSARSQERAVCHIPAMAGYEGGRHADGGGRAS
eukprot:TRINITY_DN38526_c0_g1_i1.p1 TRINITY_DN38526_c0_g1~~TRINITY_DN38526_c0_g1_i1.p1  ORF type:complete len:473 (+),score=113.25 TRINITY_DN38526_c0_g1_i1:76-1494(+)